jgi:hypothetical protein
MIESEEMVKDQEGGEWEISMRLCETMEEAIDIFGEAGALTLLNAGLKVKKQNIARAMSKAGKSREECEAAMDEYRPGRTAKTSKKKIAFDLIKANADRLNDDVELNSTITDAFVKTDWQTIIDLLEVH